MPRSPYLRLVKDPKALAAVDNGSGLSAERRTVFLKSLLRKVEGKRWTEAKAAGCGAAILATVPADADSGEPCWRTEDAPKVEYLFALAVDHGWEHHGGDSPVDVSSGATRYETADGKRVGTGRAGANVPEPDGPELGCRLRQRPHPAGTPTAAPRERQEHDPLRHSVPLRIEGLNVVEDIVRNPKLTAKLQEEIGNTVARIDYDAYLDKVAKPAETDAGKERLKAARKDAFARKPRNGGDDLPHRGSRRMGTVEAVWSRGKRV
jgi:hypothetical protein